MRSFSDAEREELLGLHGVGATVVRRLEEIGIASFAELQGYDAEGIAERVASLLQSRCWKNSPQARAALNAAIALAREQQGG